MVALNLTLLVQVGLFLAFTWLMNTYVFKPLLQVMDNRAAQMEQDRTRSQEAGRDAARLEKEYAAQVAILHREASTRLNRALRDAQNEHSGRVQEVKRAGESAVAEAREAARAKVAEERKHYPALAAELAGEMAARLGLEGGAQ